MGHFCHQIKMKLTRKKNIYNKSVILRRDSEKIGKFLGKCNRETKTAEHNGPAIYSQVQRVTRADGPQYWQEAKLEKQVPCPQGNLSSPDLFSLEITSRPQLYFSSRTVKYNINSFAYTERNILKHDQQKKKASKI